MVSKIEGKDNNNVKDNVLGVEIETDKTNVKDNNKDNKEVVVSLREIADGVVAASDENFDESETMLNIAGPNAMYSDSDLADIDLPASP